MNLFKRIFGWPFRGKGRLGGRRDERRNAGRGRNTSGASLHVDRESNSMTSDTSSWPSPHMLMELGARRAAASNESLSIVQSSQSRNDILPTSNPDISINPHSRYSERTLPYHQSGTTVSRSSIHLRPFSAVAPTLNDQLADEEFEDGNAPLEGGHPSLRPTYNVTVHRRKVHAITQFPSTSMHDTPGRSDLSNSTTSANSAPNSPERNSGSFPLPLLPQSQSDIAYKFIDDSHLLQVLGDDAELLQALQLYYSKDPAKMFKNSPLRPELGPRSASEGDVNNYPSFARASGSKSLDLDISTTPPLDENSENASFLNSILQQAAPVIPLNIQPRHNATRDTMGAIPHRVLPQINTADLRLSSPALFDILFSNSLRHPSHDEIPTADPQTPLREITTQNTPPVKVSSSKSNLVSDDCTPVMDIEEDKENRPPLKVYYEHMARNVSPDAALDRDQTGGAHRLDIPPNPLRRPRDPVSPARSTMCASVPSHMRPKSSECLPANSQSTSRSPTETLRSVAGSEIVDAYADMTTYGTDSEEEDMIERAIIATWEPARLTSLVHSSPNDLLSPSTTLSPLSPTSTSELETPTVSLDRRRVSWSPESKKSHLTGEDINTAIHVQNEASDTELLIHSSLYDGIPLKSSASPSPQPPPTSRPRNRRIFRPYSVSIAPSEYPSPHRGIVGLDGGSNREAFLYGTEDDETFTHKLDFRMASVGDGASAAHERRLPPGNTPRRVKGGTVRYSTPLNDIKNRRSYVVADRLLSPAASVHVDGEVETRRPSPHRRSPAKQTFSDKLGLSPNKCKSNEGVDVFGTVQDGSHSSYHHQISPGRLRNPSTAHSECRSAPWALATKSSTSRIPRLRALGPDPGHSRALLSVISSPARADIRGPLRTFPRPKIGSRTLRPNDKMAFGARITVDSPHPEPH